MNNNLVIFVEHALKIWEMIGRFVLRRVVVTVYNNCTCIWKDGTCKHVDQSNFDKCLVMCLIITDIWLVSFFFLHFDNFRVYFIYCLTHCNDCGSSFMPSVKFSKKSSRTESKCCLNSEIELQYSFNMFLWCTIFGRRSNY